MCERDSVDPRVQRYNVLNKRHGDILCVISYYKPWKQFVVVFDGGVVFNKECLETMGKALEMLNAEGGLK